MLIVFQLYLLFDNQGQRAIVSNISKYCSLTLINFLINLFCYIQEPDTQYCPPAQALPQPPQLVSSLFMSVQVPIQSVSADWQDNKQLPELHSSPEAQVSPQAPQLASSVFKFTY